MSTTTRTYLDFHKDLTLNPRSCLGHATQEASLGIKIGYYYYHVAW